DGAPAPAADWPTDSGRVHGLKFHGYRIERDGTPTFLYSIGELRPDGAPAAGDTPGDAPAAATTQSIDVEEEFVPDPRDSVLFVRTFLVRGIGRSILYCNPGAKAAVREVGNGDARPIERPGGAAWLELRARDPGQPVKLVLEIAP